MTSAKKPSWQGKLRLRRQQRPDQEGTSEVDTNSTLTVRVQGGGDQVVAHVGLHALGAFADRLGLGDCLSAAVPISGERLPLHDRGKVLVQTMLVLAGGGESCADIEHLRSQERLFGQVPSDSTVYRTFRGIGPETLADLWEAMAEIRARVWRRSAATTGTAPVVLDIDASLVEIHSENKQDTAATYKGGFGYHPMFCFADATGEALAALLRPGNAAANTVADNLAVLDAALGQLPAEIAAGHREGDHPAQVGRAVVCAPTRPGPPTGSWQGAGPATSDSPWWPAPTPPFTPPSPRSKATTAAGRPPPAPTASPARARRWPSSPTWSTSPTGPKAPG